LMPNTPNLIRFFESRIGLDVGDLLSIMSVVIKNGIHGGPI